MTDTSKSLERSGRRGRRRLSPVQKYEAFVQVLTGEMTVVAVRGPLGCGPLHDHAGPRGRQEAALWTRWRRLGPGRARAASILSW